MAGDRCIIEGCNWTPTWTSMLIAQFPAVDAGGAYTPQFAAAVREEVNHWRTHTPVEFAHQIKLLRARLARAGLRTFSDGADA